jgi:ADP-heptose:LPS heptosyltransferase
MTDFVIQHGEAFRDGGYAFVRGHKVERELASPTQYYLLGPRTTTDIAGADPAADPCRRPTDERGRPDFGRLHVGVVRVGGIGDDLMLAAHCAAIKRRFPHAHITAFVRDNTGIVAGHAAIDRIVVRCGGRWLEIVRDLRERFDIFYDLRYVAKAWALHPDYGAYELECRERFGPLAWYYANWYDSNARLAELGRHLIDLTNETICCPGSVDDVRIELRPQDRKLARLLGPSAHSASSGQAAVEMNGRAYAVVHNGAGGGCIAKRWPLRHWSALTAMLRERGLEVLQVGWESDELIEGAHDLRGFTTLRETAGLVEGAQLMVDTEGALIHLAQAVRQRGAVVLFGPTPAVCFAYPGHQVVETPLECRGCWYADSDWHVRCPQGREVRLAGSERGFPCMEAIAPEVVMQAVERATAQQDRGEPRAEGRSEALCGGRIRVRSAGDDGAGA